MINDFGSNILISLSAMYGGASRSASGSVKMSRKLFAMFLRLPVREDGNEERALRTKQRRQILYGVPLLWMEYSVEGLRFKHLLHKMLDSVELRFERLVQKSLKVVGDDIMN